MNWQPEDLEDDLVKLVPLTANDLDELYAVASDPLIWEQHPDRERYKREVFQKFFDSAIESRSAFLIVEKATGKIIGSTRYHDYQPALSQIEIGYTFLARDHWGGHYNRSVKHLMIDHAFKYVDNIIFRIGAENLRSQIATSRFGAVKFGEFVGADGKLRFDYKLIKTDREV